MVGAGSPFIVDETVTAVEVVGVAVDIAAGEETVGANALNRPQYGVKRSSAAPERPANPMMNWPDGQFASET